MAFDRVRLDSRRANSRDYCTYMCYKLQPALVLEHFESVQPIAQSRGSEIKFRKITEFNITK